MAEMLRDWLPKVIQRLKPWMSSRDIEQGARWSSEIAERLNSARYGIICVTRENRVAPWLLFEAGALAKEVDSSRVCPILLGISPVELCGPLAQFQAANLGRAGMRSLLDSLNRALQDDMLSIGQVDEYFEVWWPILEKQLASLPTVLWDAQGEPELSREETLGNLTHLVELLKGEVQEGDAEALEHAMPLYLSRKEETLLKMIHGIGGRPPMSPRDVAQSLGGDQHLTEGQIDEMRFQAMRKLLAIPLRRPDDVET